MNQPSRLNSAAPPYHWRPWMVTSLAFLLASGPLLANAPPDAAKEKPASPRHAGTRAKQATAVPEFIRIVHDAKTKEPLRMETATVTYTKRVKSRSGSKRKRLVTVDMIGAVHVGEATYYAALNKQFEQYDALLYELVAPKGVRPPKGSRAASNNPAGFLQNAMKQSLELEHQLEKIDYTKKNFVHADLSPEQMSAAMKKRGDNALTITLGVLADMIRQQNAAQARAAKDGKRQAAQDVDLITLMLDPNGPTRMKRMMAQQMVDMGPNGGVGQTLDQLLIQDRNIAAMKVLARQVAGGKRKLGVFYGAAHMPDFHRRLRKMGFRVKTTSWTPAWNLQIRKKSRNSELLQLLRLLQQLNR